VKQRIGIYAGTFDPVHAGHIAFALYAQQIAKLDSVYFLPERLPRHKPHVTHLAHRAAMLEHALAPYPSLGVMELVDTRFTIKRTLPQLRGVFGDAELVFLCGSDVFVHVPKWPLVTVLCKDASFVVSLRATDTAETIRATAKDLQVEATIVDSLYPDVRSRDIREALRAGKESPGLLESVTRYARAEWLYIRIPKKHK
jgi:nicotinate-nucleotide adenylyltransferase